MKLLKKTNDSPSTSSDATKFCPLETLASAQALHLVVDEVEWVPGHPEYFASIHDQSTGLPVWDECDLEEDEVVDTIWAASEYVDDSSKWDIYTLISTAAEEYQNDQ